MKYKHRIIFCLSFFIATLSVVSAQTTELTPTLDTLSEVEVPKVALPFKDESTIPNFAREAIEFLYNENIMTGNSDGTFAAHRNLNRAEFAKLTVEATDTKKYVPLASIFPDVGSDDWFFPYVETGRILGWWGGYPNGLFKPGDYVNRAEVAKVLVKAFDLKVEEKVDEGWYEKYFRALADNGLLAYGTTMETPGAGLTPSRAEVAEQLFRFRTYKLNNNTTKALESEESIAEVDLIVDESSEISEEPAAPKKPLLEPYTPPINDEVDFRYVDVDALPQKIDSLAGKMYIDKIWPHPQKLFVAPNEPNIELLKLKIRSEGGVLRTRSIQVKISGNGTFQMLSRIWLEENGVQISDRINPLNELIQLKFNKELVLEAGQSTILTVKGNIDALVDSEDAIRVALFLPTWISANTNKKIGFFPFSGTDVIVE
ncbi:MAG TPA: S-layer homology domain-containing protein [Candidatus Gracilibacteria bacterium]